MKKSKTDLLFGVLVLVVIAFIVWGTFKHGWFQHLQPAVKHMPMP